MVYLDPATEPPMGTGCRAGAHIAADRPGSDLFRGRREHPATRVVIGDPGRSWAFRRAPCKREVAGSTPAEGSLWRSGAPCRARRRPAPARTNVPAVAGTTYTGSAGTAPATVAPVTHHRLIGGTDSAGGGAPPGAEGGGAWPGLAARGRPGRVWGGSHGPRTSMTPARVATRAGRSSFGCCAVPVRGTH